ncbi:MAG: hypothetical protein ACRC1Z_04860 [Waterburya sp.]
MNRVRKIVSIATLLGLVSGALTITGTVTLASSLTKQNQNKQERIVEENSLKIQLQNCQRENAEVICSFLVTNLGADDVITIDVNDSSSFDYSAGQYIAQSGQLALEKGTSNIQARLLNGITAKATLSFEIPASATKLAGVEIVYSTNNNGSSKIMYREVDIERPQ